MEEKDSEVAHWKSYEKLAYEAVEMKRWLAFQIEQAKCRGVVIGLSGGFDSSFAAFIATASDCLKTGGPHGSPVLGISMPCNSSPDSITDAFKVAEKLLIPCVQVNLEKSVDCLVKDINRSRNFLPNLNPTEIGNIKARMRMITLYSFAASTNRLVLNTTNLSEALTGNGTKFGDGAGDLSLFLAYTKTELYRMAEVLNFNLVFPEIFAKTPTADLEPGQTDEHTMGIKYFYLDAIICGVDKDDRGVKFEIGQKNFDHFVELVNKSRHKRKPMPYYKPQGFVEPN